MLYYCVCLQACLGAKAKSSEKNIVEVTTTDSSDSSVTHTILNLQSGRLDQVNDAVHPHQSAFCCMMIIQLHNVSITLYVKMSTWGFSKNKLFTLNQVFSKLFFGLPLVHKICKIQSFPVRQVIHSN